jgi:hypothetical protein
VVSEDVMDDGSPIRLSITIDRTQGSAVFDFTGTGACVRVCVCGGGYGNGAPEEYDSRPL